MHNRRWHLALALAGILLLAKAMAAYSFHKEKQAVPASSPLQVMDEPVSIPIAVFKAFV